MSERHADPTRRLFAKARDERASGRGQASPRGSALRLVPPPSGAGGSAQRWLRPSLLGLGALAAVVGLLAVLSALRAPPATAISARGLGRQPPPASGSPRSE